MCVCVRICEVGGWGGGVCLREGFLGVGGMASVASGSMCGKAGGISRSTFDGSLEFQV